MAELHPKLAAWFAREGWQPHPHQRAMLAPSEASARLLVAPTGAGKTFAGFLPSLNDLLADPGDGLHTLYISPLKALASDIRRNLTRPVQDIGLDIRIEDRTGDTPATQKKRQRVAPPHILLTTPESLALLISYPEAPRMFEGLKRVVVDEIHALIESKRGDQLMLALATLRQFAPDLQLVALSATVEDPQALAHYLAPDCALHIAEAGPPPHIEMLRTKEPPPWAGGGGRYAIEDVLREVKAHKTTLIFHNTRAQAEIFFHHLWLANTENLPIAIHHGSLSRAQRDAVEAAMVAGQLRAVVCTGTLDLGIDWGDVDLVIQIGSPKNVKRLVQRIGRANHSYNTPSKALVVPANRFEVLECAAALEAVAEGTLDGEAQQSGARDVLCQHILIRAASAPILPDALFAELRTAPGYRDLTRAEFDDCLDFVATGGYAFRAYDTWQRLKPLPDGSLILRDPRAAQRIRMNIGTIQDTDTLKVRMRGNQGFLGEIEESFASTLSQGDTFLIGGRIVRFDRLKELVVEVSRSASKTPRVAVFNGTKFATTTQLSMRILQLLERGTFGQLPPVIQSWLETQARISRLPDRAHLLVESFPHNGRAHTAIYAFAGRNAQQTLGLLLTRRMEDMGLGPLGFVATDYATMIWSLSPVEEAHALFEARPLQEDLESWLAQNAVMKRTFRGVATIAGLIERRSPTAMKSGKQATFSSDILYDTLLKYEPDHLLMRLTRDEAMRGLIGFDRLEQRLRDVDGRILHQKAPHVTPFAAPLILEVGKVPIHGSGRAQLEEEAADALMREAGLQTL